MSVKGAQGFNEHLVTPFWATPVTDGSPSQGPVMLGLHRTPEWLGTDLRPKMAKLAVNWELVGKVVCSSYVTHQKVISYTRKLAITRAYSPLKSTSTTTAFNRRKTVVELVNFTCEWPNSQLDPTSIASWSQFARWPRMSFSTVVNRSQVTLDFFSHASFCRVTQVIRGGRAQVVGRSLIGRKTSPVSRGSVSSVSRWSGPSLYR